jgi:hypothetical protein
MKKSGLTGMLVMLVACYPGDVTSIAELDVVMTRYATDYNFGQVTRFTMPDTIIHINTDDPNAIIIPRANDQQTLDRVRANLVAQGWTEVDWEDAAGGDPVDVAILNLATASENTQWWVSYPPGGCWYYPCYGWGWYWPPYVGTTSYDAGTYFMVMADANQITPSDSTQGVWGGVVNGVLTSSSASDYQRLLNGIDQAFSQSPYLGGSSSN